MGQGAGVGGLLGGREEKQSGKEEGEKKKRKREEVTMGGLLSDEIALKVLSKTVHAQCSHVPQRMNSSSI